MTKYLIKASYSPEGFKGVMASGGTARQDAISKMVADLGGSLESMYFAFGDTDVFLVVDAPNPETVVAIGGTVVSSGALSKYETVQLIEPSVIDDATNISVDYTPPGQQDS